MVRGFQCSISALDPGTNYIDCISGVGTRDPIKIYRENQNVVLNTIFTQNHQYIYFVLKKITNYLDISLLLGHIGSLYFAFATTFRPPLYIATWSAVFNVASQPWTREPITSIASLGSGPGTQSKYIGKTKM